MQSKAKFLALNGQFPTPISLSAGPNSKIGERGALGAVSGYPDVIRSHSGAPCPRRWLLTSAEPWFSSHIPLPFVMPFPKWQFWPLPAQPPQSQHHSRFQNHLSSSCWICFQKNACLTCIHLLPPRSQNECQYFQINHNPRHLNFVFGLFCAKFN